MSDPVYDPMDLDFVYEEFIEIVRASFTFGFLLDFLCEQPFAHYTFLICVLIYILKEEQQGAVEKERDHNVPNEAEVFFYPLCL